MTVAKGAILVVENEPFMREAMEDILNTIGLDVISTGDGQAGVKAYLTQREIIELVILDMKLPGMDGTEILRRLREIDPNVKILIATGYDEIEVRQLLKDEPQPISFLKKPYNADGLLTAVEKILA